MRGFASRKTIILGLAGFLTAPWPGTEAAPAAPPPAPPPRAAAAPAAAAPSGPTFVGVWSGSVTQVGRSTGYTMVLTIEARTATTDYPDLGCSGRLTRLGSGAGYVFYSETITSGRYDSAKKSGCIDGTLTVSKQNGRLLLGWFGAFQEQPVQATATLTTSDTFKP